MFRPVLLAAALAASLPAAVLAQGSTRIEPGATPAPPDAKVYFIAPRDGARVTSPVLVQFGLSGMGVTQAGSTVANAGHHHLLVDVSGPLDPTDILPADKSHLHFGGGQTETRVDLAPGRHTLRLVLGDAQHRPFRPLVASETITVTVADPDQPARRRKKRPRRYY